MIRATRDWFRRNRINIAIGAGVIGAGYLAGQYVLGKITETRQRMSDDRIARENLRRRFEQNQEDCTYTVLALLPTAAENVLKELPTEQIAQELRQQRSERLARSTASSEIAPSDVPSTTDEEGRSFASGSYIHASQVAVDAEGEAAAQRPRRSKAQLWNELKISSITRAFTLLYTICLLTLLTRIQLNLLGRRNYLSSVVSLASPPQDSNKISLENRDDDNLEQDYGSDFETNRKYLTFSWWLLHRGWKDIMTKVERAVKEVFGPIGLKEDLSFIRLSELTIEVRMKVEGATEEERRKQQWLSFLLPSRADEGFVLHESGIISSSPPTSPLVESTRNTPYEINQSLRRLLDETSDLVDSPSFTYVLTQMLDAAFSQLIDGKIAIEAYKSPGSRLNPDSSSDTASSIMPGGSRIQELGEDGNFLGATNPVAKAKLATLLATFTKSAHVISSAGSTLGTSPSAAADPSAPPLLSEQLEGPGAATKDANEFLAAIEAVRDLEAFAAVVYSSNFEFEGVDVVGKGQEQEREAGLPSSITTEGEAGEASVVDVAREEVEGNLESAWGRALARDNAQS